MEQIPIKRSKGKPKRTNNIPDDIAKSLQNRTLPLIDLVASVEKYKQEYDFSVKHISSLLGITEAMYYKLLKILHSHNQVLIDRVRNNECSVRLALQILKDNIQPKTPEWESIFRYKWLDRVRELDNYSIIFESRRNLLYRTNDGVFLGIVYLDQEIICQINDDPRLIDALVINFQNGGLATFDSDGIRLSEESEKKPGYLKYFVITHLTDLKTEDLRKEGVFTKMKPDKNIHDLRIQNLICSILTRDKHPEACPRYGISRNRDNIVIIDKIRNHVYKTDYCKWLYSFLTEKIDALRLQARDNRLCIELGNQKCYLYHIVMAAHLYGEPTSESELAAKISLLQENYLNKGFVVDHLDTDTCNNHLSNLMLMTKSQNSQKKSSQSKISELGLPVFCWQERYDDTSIRLMAGYVHPLHTPHYLIQGVFSVTEYLEEIKNLPTAIKNDEKILYSSN